MCFQWSREERTGVFGVPGAHNLVKNLVKFCSRSWPWRNRFRAINSRNQFPAFEEGSPFPVTRFYPRPIRNPTDFEPRVSFLYRQVPSYTALFNRNSMVLQPPLRGGMPSYTALYPALRCKQPPHKPPKLLLAEWLEKGQLRDRED
jgi:hypothetical protein